MAARFPHAYVLNVLSDDHPGIVAAVSDAVSRFDGNIDAVAQTVLDGYFSLVMIVSFPSPLEPETLAAEVRGPAKADRGFAVNVRPFVPVKTSGIKVERFVLTAFGKDKPGIIRRLSRCLAGKDVNIVDLHWECRGDDFVMVSQVDVPADREIAALQSDLEAMGREEGFTARLQHENVFVATNQLVLRRNFVNP